MKTMTITAAALAAAAIATSAMMWSGSPDRALADARPPAQTIMPIDQLTADAANLPVQTIPPIDQLTADAANPPVQ
jgi:hypothetical protein